MKLYRSEQYGFEVDIPKQWSFHSSTKDGSIFFTCPSSEAFNIQIAPLQSTSSLEEIENKLQREAQKKGYTSLVFGRFSIAGKEHVWVRYYRAGGVWCKKYIVDLNKIEYTLTATCLDQRLLLDMEKEWDQTAGSIREGSFDVTRIMQILAQPAYLSEIPGRIELCQQALAHVNRDRDPETWAALELEVAKNFAQNPQGDQVQNAELAILHNEKALEVFTRQAYPECWANIYSNLAAVYRRRLWGEHADNLEQALRYCQEALEVIDRQASPLLWAGTHNNLANVYRDRLLGERGDNLEQAIEHCKMALGIFAQDTYPFQWAMVQNNLGNAYQDRILGDHGQNLEEAICYYQQALEVFTRNAHPEDWAWTHCNLGASYHNRIHGDRSENLEKSIYHSRQALQVFTRASLPEKWALTHFNLGNAYLVRKLDEEEKNLKQAMEHYEQAMTVFDQRTSPERSVELKRQMDLAKRRLPEDKPPKAPKPPVSSGNRSIEDQMHQTPFPGKSVEDRLRQANPKAWASLRMLQAMNYFDEQRGDRVQNLEQAVYFNRQALEVFTRWDSPEEWAGALVTLGEIYRNLSLIKDLDTNVTNAILCYEQALEVATRESSPELWAAAHNNLGIVYTKGKFRNRPENIEKAISHCQQALEIYIRTTYADDWAMTQNNLGNAYRCLTSGDRAENIEKAIFHFQQALEVQDHQADRIQWAGTHYNLVFTYQERLHGNRFENLEQANFHAQKALEVYTRSQYPQDWAKLQSFLEILHKELSRDETKIKRNRVNGTPRLTYPDLYNRFCNEHPHPNTHIKLIYADVPDIKYATNLLLVYQWEGALSREETDQFRLRVAVYLSCAIFDAARRSKVYCAPCPILNGQRPTWMIEGIEAPVSVSLSEADVEDQTIQLSLGPILISVNRLPINKIPLKKLMDGFKDMFCEFDV